MADIEGFTTHYVGSEVCWHYFVPFKRGIIDGWVGRMTLVPRYFASLRTFRLRRGDSYLFTRASIKAPHSRGFYTGWVGRIRTFD